MNRKTSIILAKVAGYHDDTARFTRLIIESRVNRQTMNEAWHNGKSARANGVKCTCYECKARQAEHDKAVTAAIVEGQPAHTLQLAD